MNEILFKIHSFLDKANRGPVEVSDEILDEFAANCRAALKRQFADKRNEKFTIRMSNIGRPLCVLQQEQSGVAGEVPSPWHKSKMLTGDVIEASAIAIMRLAGVNVEAVSQPVSLDIGGITIDGTYDTKIGGAIYDVKSASPYAFANKFSEGSFPSMVADDAFGYVAQGFGYAEADTSRFGGWIAVDKVTGEWSVSETPSDTTTYQAARAASLQKIADNVKALTEKTPFTRCFEEVDETYYGKPTGNKVLPFNCEYCAFKSTCWPHMKALPTLGSKASNPKIKYYTHIKED